MKLDRYLWAVSIEGAVVGYPGEAAIRKAEKALSRAKREADLWRAGMIARGADPVPILTKETPSARQSRRVLVGGAVL